MATNPMQRKARNSFLLGMLITLVIAGAIIALLFIQLKNYKEKGGKYAFAYEFFGSMSNILDLKYSDYLTALDTVGITNTTDILATGVKIV